MNEYPLIHFFLRLFDWVIETSVMASILVGLILCVKFLLGNKLTPKWHYLLWMILIVRLILPSSPGSEFSIYSILNNSYESMTSQAVTENKERPEPITHYSNEKLVMGDEQLNAAPPPIVNSEKELQPEKQTKQPEPVSFRLIAFYIWIAGVIVLAFATYLVHRRLQYDVNKQPVISDERVCEIFTDCKKTMGIRRNIPLHFAEKISSPTVLGFFQPRILLSREQVAHLNEQQLRHIFYHELAHIKRGDVGMNWLSYGLLIVHWFNPLLWYAYVRMREDQEVACDAYALTFMGEEEKVYYGHTIISLLERYTHGYPAPSLANLSKNKRILKRRILMIKKFNKKSYGWSILGIVAVLALSALTLLNANEEGAAKKLEQGEAKETAVEEVEANGFEPELNQFIAKHAEEFRNVTDISEYNEKFERLIAEFVNQYSGYPSAEAAYDFENLRSLLHWGSQIDFSYSSFKEEPITDEIVLRAKQVPEYTKQLLHDLDVAMNKNGQGETFGVSHQLNGERVRELEELAFYRREGDLAELKEYNKENYQVVELEYERFDPRWKKFIAEQAEAFKNTNDFNEYLTKLEQFDEEFGKQFPSFFIEEALNDYKNLRVLSMMGSHHSYWIGQDVQKGIVESAESNEDLKQTFEYTKQLLNDLDVAMNKNGQGETFGVSHMLDGDKVDEIEVFLWGIE